LAKGDRRHHDDGIGVVGHDLEDTLIDVARLVQGAGQMSRARNIEGIAHG
jgi:hypothetical protein